MIGWSTSRRMRSGEMWAITNKWRKWQKCRQDIETTRSVYKWCAGKQTRMRGVGKGHCGIAKDENDVLNGGFTEQSIETVHRHCWRIEVAILSHEKTGWRQTACWSCRRPWVWSSPLHTRQKTDTKSKTPERKKISKTYACVGKHAGRLTS